MRWRSSEVAVGLARVAVGRDVQPDQPDLAVVDAGVALGQLHLGLAQGLDLAALQGDAGLEGVEDLVVPPRLAVGGDGPGAGRLGLGGHRAFEATAERDCVGPGVPAAGSLTPMLRLSHQAHLAIVGHAYDGLPERGLRAARRPGRGRAGCPTGGSTCSTRAATWPSPAASTPSIRRTTSGPTATPRTAGSRSSAWSTATPTPRPTRRRPTWPRRPIPSWHYVIVSLKREAPVVRSYRIVDGEIAEEPVTVEGR